MPRHRGGARCGGRRACPTSTSPVRQPVLRMLCYGRHCAWATSPVRLPGGVVPERVSGRPRCGQLRRVGIGGIRGGCAPSSGRCSRKWRARSWPRSGAGSGGGEEGNGGAVAAEEESGAVARAARRKKELWAERAVRVWAENALCALAFALLAAAVGSEPNGRDASTAVCHQHQ
jgi:hypothetical protein